MYTQSAYGTLLDRQRSIGFGLFCGVEWNAMVTDDESELLAIATHLNLQSFFAAGRIGVLHNVDYSFLKGQIETHCQWHVKTNLLSNGIV